VEGLGLVGQAGEEVASVALWYLPVMYSSKTDTSQAMMQPWRIKVYQHNKYLFIKYPTTPGEQVGLMRD
jgi:hypothetical protein